MTTYSAAEAETNLAQVMETALNEPVTITRPGQPNLVLVSEEALDELVDARRRRAASDAFREWAARSDANASPEVEELTEEDIVRLVHELR